MDERATTLVGNTMPADDQWEIRCVLTSQWIGPCYRPGRVSSTSAWVDL